MNKPNDMTQEEWDEYRAKVADEIGPVMPGIVREFEFVERDGVRVYAEVK